MSTMSSRSSTSRATLPSEAEVTPDLIQAVPELAGFDGALVAFDSKQQDGYHWYLMPGQLALEEDDEPMLVVLSEANVSLLLFKNEKDVPFGLPFVSSALTRTRGAATLERSALLSELTWSDGDNATKGDDKLGGIHGESPSSTARAVAAPGSTERPKAPVNLFGPPAHKPAFPAQAAGTPTMAAHLTKGLLGAAASTVGGGSGSKDLALVARLTTPLARARGGVLTGGLLPVPDQPLLQSSGQVDLPGFLPTSSSSTLAGLLIGGGDEAMPTKGPQRAPREVPAVSSLEIERLAADAMVGLGPGKGAAVQPPAFDDHARQPHECIVFGLGDQELLMATPKIIKMLCGHMNVSLPELSFQDLGAMLYKQMLLNQLNQLVTLAASHVDTSLAVLTEYVYRSSDELGLAASFQRMRYLMTTLSTAYAVHNGVGGSYASAGGSVRCGGPGANPNGVAPKACDGGMGAGGLHGPAGAWRNAPISGAGACFDDGFDRSTKGFNFNFNKNHQQKGGGDGLGGVYTSHAREGLGPRCFVAAGDDDDDRSGVRKAPASTIMADAFLQSAYVVSEDEEMRSALRDLRDTVEANPLSHHTRKIQAFGVCATASPDLMNILTSANIVVPKGKPESLPEFLLAVVRAVMRIQGKVLAAMEALLRDLLYYDALVKPMAKCLITLDMSAIDMKSVMGREGVARLGLDKTKLDVKAAPSTLAFHAVWPVLTFAFGLVNQWDEDASMTMVRLGSRVTEAMMAGHAFAEALSPIGFHFQLYTLMAEDLHKGGVAFPCLADVYESEARGEFMTAHRSRSVVGVGGIDLNSKAFKDAVSAVVKSQGTKTGATRPTAEAGDTDEAAAVKKAANVTWATAFLKEATLPVPAATAVSTKLIAAWRYAHPKTCWRVGLRGVCDNKECPVCNK